MSTVEHAEGSGNWFVLKPVPPTVNSVFQTVCASAAFVEKGIPPLPWRVCDIGVLLEEVERLNNLNLALPPWLRRILRSQGRINRILCSCAEACLDVLDDFADVAAPGELAQARHDLFEARQVNRSSGSSALSRRVNRRQSAFNEMLNGVVFRAGNCAIASAEIRACCGSTVPEWVEQFRWHVKEGRFLSSRRAKRPAWHRRVKARQQDINRCHIIAIRLLNGFLSTDR
ncbi:MAG: hypothetical protein WC360_02100 [Opitutales bacterium]